MGNLPIAAVDEEDEYVWFHVIQWVSEHLPSDLVMKYDTLSIKV